MQDIRIFQVTPHKNPDMNWLVFWTEKGFQQKKYFVLFSEASAFVEGTLL